MADSSVAITAGAGTSIDTRTNPDGEHRQVVVLGDPDAAATATVSTLGLVVASYVPATATRTNVSAVITDTQLLAAATRRRFTVWNDSTAYLYLLLGTGTTTVANYTIRLDGGGYYEQDWAGAVRGLWASAIGTARITELA
jgi:hypothetical protein